MSLFCDNHGATVQQHRRLKGCEERTTLDGEHLALAERLLNRSRRRGMMSPYLAVVLQQICLE